MKGLKDNNLIQNLILNLRFTNTILLVCFSTFITFNTVHAGVINKPLNNLGLVAYYSFNEGSDTIAVDNSGNGNTGTLINGPVRVGGKQGKALSFDGVDDYVNTQSDSYSDIRTETVWVKAGVQSNIQTLLGVKGPGSDAFWTHLDIASTGVLQYTEYKGGNYQLTGTTDIADNQWHFIALTKDSSNLVNLYIDGVYETGGTSSRTISDWVTGCITTIGTYQWTNYYIGYFNGTLDDIRIYSRALSATDITQLYNQTFRGTVTTTSSNNNGLVGYWSFEDATGTKATDFSGNGNTGTLTNMDTNTAWVDGKQGKALEFDGVDDYVTLSKVSDLQLSAGTVSGWIKTDVDTGQTFFSIANGDGATNSNFWAVTIGNGSSQYFSNELVTIARGSGGSLDYALAYDTTDRQQIIDGNWHYITATSDGAVTKLYVDGVQKTLTVGYGSNNGRFTDIAIADIATLGARKSSGSLGFYANGLLDDIRIYSRALSSTEVSTLYNSTKSGHVTFGITPRNILDDGLVGHWTFDGKDLTTTTAIDTSGNNNNGTLTNGPTPVRGKIGQALSFDGVDDYVNVASRHNLNSSTFSVGFWVNPDNLSDNSMFVSNAKMTAWYDGWAVGMDRGVLTCDDGDICLWVSNATGYSGYGYIDYPYNLPVNEWTHVIITFNALTKIVKFYINGELLYQTTSSIVPTPNDSSVTGIGEWPSTQFAGGMDDVRIYNRVLSSDEIKTLYNLGR